MGVPLYTPLTWQEAQATVVCLPVSAKLVWVVWLMVVVGQPAVVWQLAQLVPTIAL